MAAMAPVAPVHLPARFGDSRQFRLIKHAKDRWDVQRLDARWVSIYSDDSAHRAFAELKRNANVCDGCVACARCGWVLATPRLRGGQVLCEVCHTLSAPLPWMPFLTSGLAFAISVALMIALAFMLNNLLYGGM